ncbi:MAG: hypothetical protein DRJ52_09740, partial [Thermoprotei archaeon]
KVVEEKYRLHRNLFFNIDSNVPTVVNYSVQYTYFSDLWPPGNIKRGSEETPFTISIRGQAYSNYLWGFKAVFSALNTTVYDNTLYVFYRWRVEKGAEVWYVYNTTLELAETELDGSRYYYIKAEYNPLTVPPPPSGEETTTIRLNGSVYCLPYQWIGLQGNFTPGIYRIEVSSLFGAPRELIVAVLASPNGSVKYVPVHNLVFNLTKHCSMLHLVEEIDGECVKPKYVMPCMNYSNYYLVGLGVMNPCDSTQVESLKPWLLSNGTTLAVYNVTLVYTKGADRTVYWKLLAITSLDLEINAVYDTEGVYLIWNVSYSHLIPRWIVSEYNISDEKPYQLLRLSAFYGSKELWRVKLGEVPVTLSLNESRYCSYGAVYVSHEQLQKIFGFKNATVVFKVMWSAYDIPGNTSIKVYFIPIGIELVRFKEMSNYYYWQVAVCTIVDNIPGGRLKAGLGTLKYIDPECPHCPKKAKRISDIEEIYEFTTPKYDFLRESPVVIYYIPVRTKNYVYYVYSARG